LVCTIAFGGEDNYYCNSTLVSCEMLVANTEMLLSLWYMQVIDDA